MEAVQYMAFESDVVPEDWKSAKIVTLYKGVSDKGGDV